MKKMGLKINQKGMTLVELLVAMAIFAAAIVPMLYAFVYSTGYNFRSQQTLQATGISQAIIEKCKAANTNYDDIITALSDGSILSDNNSFDVPTPTISGSTFTFSGVKPQNYDRSDLNDAVDAGNPNRRSYDVEVTLTPAGNSVTDFSVVHTMRSGITANFIYGTELQAQDDIAEGLIFDRIKQEVLDNATATPTGLTDAQIESLAQSVLIPSLDIKKVFIERRITVTCDSTGTNVKVEYYYDGYGDEGSHPTTISLSGSASVGGTTYTISSSAAVPVDPDPTDGTGNFTRELLTGENASSVFFYYYPAYKATNGLDGTSGTSDDTSNFRDHFILENNLPAAYLINGSVDSGRLDFYLFKQYDDTNIRYIDTDVESLEDDKYECEVDITSTASFPTNLYHNLLWNSATCTELASASYPTINEGSDCYNRTYVIHVNPDNLTDRSLTQPLATENYSKTFYSMDESVILEDQASFPIWSEKYDGVSMITYYGARYTITIVVYDHNTSREIERVTAEFVNW